jgi:hypothetical protein
MFQKMFIMSIVLLSAHVYAEPPKTLTVEQARNILQNTDCLPDPAGDLWDVVMTEDHGTWQSDWYKDFQLEFLQKPNVQVTRTDYKAAEGRVYYKIALPNQPKGTRTGGITLVRRGTADMDKITIQQSKCPSSSAPENAACSCADEMVLPI